jgi:hypothetical protein
MTATPGQRPCLDAIHERMLTRLVLLKLTLVDVFASALNAPADQSDERALELLEQLAGDLRALQLAAHRWIAQRGRRQRSQRPETPRQASDGAR